MNMKLSNRAQATNSNQTGAVGAGASDHTRAAQRNYRRHGTRGHDLSNRAEVLDLIRRSPQVDNLRDTNSDDHRCGAAAITNALLLDGNHAANAQAVRQFAGPDLSTRDNRALQAFESGEAVTPRHAARIQNIIYRSSTQNSELGVGRRGNRDNRDGMGPFDLTDTVARLRAAQPDALSNTRDVRFVGQSGHWTMTHTDREGRSVHANSWPNASGQATVTPGRGVVRGAVVNGRANPETQNDVYIAPQEGRTYYQIHESLPGTDGVSRLVELRQSVPRGGQIPNDRQDFRQQPGFFRP